MVNAKDEQKMKSLERLLEEKKDDDDKNAAANIGPTIKGPKDIGVGVTMTITPATRWTSETPCTIIRRSTRSGSRRQGSLKNTCRGREVEK